MPILGFDKRQGPAGQAQERIESCLLLISDTMLTLNSATSQTLLNSLQYAQLVDLGRVCTSPIISRLVQCIDGASLNFIHQNTKQNITFSEELEVQFPLVPSLDMTQSRGGLSMRHSKPGA